MVKEQQADWSASYTADTNPRTRRRMGEHLSTLVSDFRPQEQQGKKAG
jgi:hypothetical protein